MATLGKLGEVEIAVIEYDGYRLLRLRMEADSGLLSEVHMNREVAFDFAEKVRAALENFG